MEDGTFRHLMDVATHTKFWMDQPEPGSDLYFYKNDDLMQTLLDTLPNGGHDRLKAAIPPLTEFSGGELETLIGQLIVRATESLLYNHTEFSGVGFEIGTLMRQTAYYRSTLWTFEGERLRRQTNGLCMCVRA